MTSNAVTRSNVASGKGSATGRRAHAAGPETPGVDVDGRRPRDEVAQPPDARAVGAAEVEREAGAGGIPGQGRAQQLGAGLVPPVVGRGDGRRPAVSVSLAHPGILWACGHAPARRGVLGLDKSRRCDAGRAHDGEMRLGLQVSNFTWPDAPASIGPTFARIARNAGRGRAWHRCGSWTTSSRSRWSGRRRWRCSRATRPWRCGGRHRADRARHPRHRGDVPASRACSSRR